MSSYRCCGFRRTRTASSSSSSSLNIKPVQALDNSRTEGRFPLTTTPPSNTVGSVEVVEEKKHTNPVHGVKMQSKLRCSEHDRRDIGLSDNGPGRASSARLREVGTIVSNSLKRISSTSRSGNAIRFSDATHRSSNEDADRRQELKRALHHRLSFDLFEDDLGTQSYDTKAVPTWTSRGLESQYTESAKRDPEEISRVSQQDHMAAIPVRHSQADGNVSSQNIVGHDDAAQKLARMLTLRERRISDDHARGDDKSARAASAVIEAKRSYSTDRYVFSPETSPQKQNARMSSPSQGQESFHSVRSSVASTASLFSSYANGLGADKGEGCQPNYGSSTIHTITGSADDTTCIREHNPELRHVRHASLGAADCQDISANAFKCALRGSKTQGLKHHDSSDCYSSENEYGNRFSPQEMPRMPGAYERGSSCDNSLSSGAEKREHSPRQLPTSRTVLPSVSMPFLLQQCAAEESDCKEAPEYRTISTRRVSSASQYKHRMPIPPSGIQTRRTASSVYSQDSKKMTPAQQISYTNINAVANWSNVLDAVSLARHESNDIVNISPSDPQVSCVAMDIERASGNDSFIGKGDSFKDNEERSFNSSNLYRNDRMSMSAASVLQKNMDEIAFELALTNPVRKASLGNADFDGSSEQQRSLSRGYSSRRVNSVIRHDVPQGESVWERAIREHAQEDQILQRTRLGSNGGMHSMQPDINTRKDDYANTQEKKGRPRWLSPNSQSSNDHPNENLQARLVAYQLPRPLSPMEPVRIQTLRQTVDGSSAPESKPHRNRSPGSWSRYPSFDREKRSEGSAGESDSVFARDFAIEDIKLRNAATEDVDPAAAGAARNRVEGRGRRRKSKSMTFSKGIAQRLSNLYQASSLELSRKYAYGSHGHRSSISQGRATEYPELEMLGPISPQLPPQGPIDVDIQDLELDQEEAKVLEDFGKVHIQGGHDMKGAGPTATMWSDLYQDCVSQPNEDSETAEVSRVRSRSHSHLGVRPSETQLTSHSREDHRATSLDVRRPTQRSASRGTRKASSRSDAGHI